MMAEAAEEKEPARLSELLESGWRLLEEVESNTEASSGAVDVQRRVQRGLELLERAARGVAQLELFSRNEELEEIASADLRFMLVPALLAALTLRQVAPSRRLEHLRRARGLFLDFLRLCRDYALARFDLPPEAVDGEGEEHGGEAARAPSDGQASLMAMAAARRAKIERYKQKKELENQLASLKPFVDSGQAEEEQIREFYLLQIKKWVTVSLEEIESIDQEIAILNRRDALQCEQMLKIAPPPVFPSLLPGSIHTTFPATPTSNEALHPYSGCCPGKVYHWGKGSSFCCFWQGGVLEGRWVVREGRVDSSCSCSFAQLEESWAGFLSCRVFGAGYPSLATMTVDEWYDQHQKQGVLPDQGISQKAPAGPEDQQKEKENATEEEEQAAALKAREWDDWKDLNPRGYGNRKNMG